MTVLKRYTGSAWEVVGAPQSGTTVRADYGPALTAATTSPTLGTGSLVDGRYTQNDKEVVGFANITFGTSGTNAGSGEYRISLPVAARSEATNRAVGTGTIYNSGVGLITVVAQIPAGVTTYVRMLYTAAAPILAHNVPWAWTISNELGVNFAYEAA